MFFQGDKDNINSGLDSALNKVNLLEDGLLGVYTLIRDEIDPRKIMKDADEINRSAAKMARESLGRGREISNMLTITFARARENTLEFGVGIQENLDLFKAINNQLQTTRLLTSQQLTDMNALAMSAGLTAEEMAGFVKNFDMLGKGTDETIGAIARLQTEARSYGLNVGQFMKTVGENIKLVASYNFKGGVDGLSKMVAQAQSLRIDMGNTVQFAEKLMDPSQAIETAAGFQMLGGAIGKLGHPFQLLHMAQTDMAGLQDEIVKMTAAAVTFNESTGEFDIPVTELYRLREVANLTGIKFQDLSEMALNSAKKTKKLNFLEGLNNIPEEQKEMVANLGELQGGELKISIGDKLLDVANLNETQLEELGKFQKDLNKDDKTLRAEAVGIARESLGVMQKIEAKLAQTAARPETDIITGGVFQDKVNKLTERVTNNLDALDKRVRETNFDELITTAYDKMIPDLTEELIEKYIDMTYDISERIVNEIEKFSFEDLLKGLGGKVDGDFTGNVPQVNDLVVTSQGESFQTAVDDYIFAISEQNLADLTNTISGLQSPEMFKIPEIPEINYEPPVVNVNNNSFEETSLQEDMGKMDKQLAVESVGHLNRIENILKSMTALPESIVIEEGLFMDVMDGISTNISDITTTFTDEIKDIDLDGQIEGLMKTSKISKVEFGAVENLYFSAKNIFDANNPTQQVNNLEENAESTGDLVFKSQVESFKTAVYDYMRLAISEQNLADLTNTISELQSPEIIKIPEINYEPPVVNVDNNSLEETLNNTISGLQSPEIIKTPEINYEPPVVNDKLFEIFNYLVNKENNVNDNINNANLNVNGTVTLNLEGTNQNFTQVDFNRLAQNNPEFIAMLKNALFNLDNRIDSSIMA